MEWLHFSDFHIGRKGGAQDDAMNSLVDYIREGFKTKPGRIDAIFLAGDIAYSGLKEEYINFDNIFLKPLLEIESIKGAKVYAVPGNHDVDCDATSPITWEGIRKRNQDIYFSEDEGGQKVRQPRTVIFKNYQDFVERNGIIGPNPLKR